MGILAWIVFGLLAGLIASLMVNHRGEGMLRDILLGIVGAVIGGFLFRAFGHEGVTGFNGHSMLVAIIGAVVLLVAFHAMRRTA